MLGEYIKQQIREQQEQQERRESDAKFEFLYRLPANTFAAIYAEWYLADWSAGAYYNGVFYEDWQIYYTSIRREDEGFEVLV